VKQGYVSHRTHVLNILMDAGTWVAREDLSPVSTCVPALDDALAELVVEGLVEYRQNVGYRLVASQLSRRAAQLMRRRRVPAAAIAQRGNHRRFHVGVCETVVGRVVLHDVTVEAESDAQLVDRMYEFGVVPLRAASIAGDQPPEVLFSALNEEAA
jgi:hypothetical protein